VSRAVCTNCGKGRLQRHESVGPVDLNFSSIPAAPDKPPVPSAEICIEVRGNAPSVPFSQPPRDVSNQRSADGAGVEPPNAKVPARTSIYAVRKECHVRLLAEELFQLYL